MKIASSIILGAIAAIVSLSTAAAQTAQASPLTQVYDCKDITEPMERLACYDSAVGLLQKRETNNEIVAIDSSTVKSLKREAFGFSLPSLPKLNLSRRADSKPQADDTQVFPVKTVKKSHSGYTITLENGQVWRQVSGRLNYVPRGDLTARISRGAIGSYKLSISNGKDRVRGLGVRRVK